MWLCVAEQGKDFFWDMMHSFMSPRLSDGQVPNIWHLEFTCYERIGVKFPQKCFDITNPFEETHVKCSLRRQDVSIPKREGLVQANRPASRPTTLPLISRLLSVGGISSAHFQLPLLIASIGMPDRLIHRIRKHRFLIPMAFYRFP